MPWMIMTYRTWFLQCRGNNGLCACIITRGLGLIESDITSSVEEGILAGGKC